MIRNWLRNFMIGRYGPDQFYFAIFIAAVAVGIVAEFTKFGLLMLLSYVLLIYAMFRLLSRNIIKRRRENDRFLRYWWPIRQYFVMKAKRFKSRKTHKFFKCPACKNQLRVPRGKGKIQITCPKCGERFEKKT